MDHRGTANPSEPVHRARTDERAAPVRRDAERGAAVHRDAERARIEVVARKLGASAGALEQYLRLKRAEVEPVSESGA